MQVARQDMPEPPEIPQPPEFPPPPQDMQSMNFGNLRRKREAKGISGSLPTRKG